MADRRCVIRRRIGALAVVLLAAMGLQSGCSGSAAPAPGVVIRVFAPADRKDAPDLTGELLDGSGNYRLADHAGEVVVINFWASWCAPCQAEADDLEATYVATKDDKVSFLGINIRDERGTATTFLVGRATYPSVFDPSGKLALGFAVAPTAIPSTVVVDRDGRIAAIANGALLRDDLEPVVAKLAAESS